MKLSNVQIKQLVDICIEAGNVIDKNYHKIHSTTYKEVHSPVTEVDIKVNQLIIKRLKKIYPTYGIVSEELDKEWKEFTWCIDPLDGTGNYIKKIPEFSVMIGLLHIDKPIFGIVYNPESQELFYGGEKIKPVLINSKGKISKLILKNTNKTNLIIGENVPIDFRNAFVAKLLPDNIINHSSIGINILKIVQNTSNLLIDPREGLFGVWDIVAAHAILNSAGGFSSQFNGKTIEYKFGNNKLAGGLIFTNNNKRLLETLNIIKLMEI